MSSGKYHSKTKPTKSISGDHNPAQCNHKLNGKFIHYKPSPATEGKEIIKMYDNAETRDLIVPSREPLDLPGIWPKSEFERLQKQARVYTRQERIEILEEAERKKRTIQAESDKRKKLLKRAQLDHREVPGSKMAEIDNQAMNKKYVLQRAFELRQEQEDEVKKANGLILSTKCLVIRQAQIAERDLIQKELDEENHRLDMMMEQQRQKALQDADERKKKQEESNKRHVKEVSQQIREIEVQRLVASEQKEEESRNINRSLIAMQREDEENLKEKLRNQRKTRDELNKANRELEQYKIIQKEEQRIADLRVQQFMRNKAEREATREAELLDIQMAKAREISRLQAQQQKAQDHQSALDELNALRIQEEVEREWRLKELAAAKKRKEQSEELRRGRERQLKDLRRAQALEIERDEHEFHQVAKVQNEQHHRDLEMKRLKKEAALRHRKELLQQINEKEREHITEIKEKYAEGTALQLEQDIRKLNITNILKKKVERLRENNVPEHYVRDIERQLKLCK